MSMGTGDGQPCILPLCLPAVGFTGVTGTEPGFPQQLQHSSAPGVIFKRFIKARRRHLGVCSGASVPPTPTGAAECALRAWPWPGAQQLGRCLLAQVEGDRHHSEVSRERRILEGGWAHAAGIGQCLAKHRLDGYQGRRGSHEGKATGSSVSVAQGGDRPWAQGIRGTAVLRQRATRGCGQALSTVGTSAAGAARSRGVSLLRCIQRRDSGPGVGTADHIGDGDFPGVLPKAEQRRLVSLSPPQQQLDQRHQKQPRTGAIQNMAVTSQRGLSPLA